MTSQSETLSFVSIGLHMTSDCLVFEIQSHLVQVYDSVRKEVVITYQLRKYDNRILES